MTMEQVRVVLNATSTTVKNAQKQKDKHMEHVMCVNQHTYSLMFTMAITSNRSRLFVINLHETLNV